MVFFAKYPVEGALSRANYKMVEQCCTFSEFIGYVRKLGHDNLPVQSSIYVRGLQTTARGPDVAREAILSMIKK